MGSPVEKPAKAMALMKSPIFMRLGTFSSRVMSMRLTRISLPRAIATKHYNHNDKYIADGGLDEGLINMDRSMTTFFRNEPSFKYVSVMAALCNSNGCLAKVDDHNSPLVWDYGHLTPAGADYVVSKVLLKSVVLDEFFKP